MRKKDKISVKYRRCKKTGERKRNIQKRGIAREIYSKKIIQINRQEV